MPTVPNNHDAHDDVERRRERLRRRLQELRERCGLSEHGLARERGIGREYIGKIDHEVASSGRCRCSSTSWMS
jgi:DNA-binding XRE family transcriptional regulator